MCRELVELPIRNSVILVTERTIDIHHREIDKLVRDWGARYKKCHDDGEEDFWQNYELPSGSELAERLNLHLAANANRYAISN